MRWFGIHDDTRRLTVTKVIREPGEREEIKGEAPQHWYFAKLKFRAGEQKRVSVFYEVQTITRGEGFPGSREFSPRVFEYELSPSSTWGNGRVAELNIHLKIGELVNRKIPLIEKSLSRGVWDPYRKQWSWSFKDFSLRGAAPLKFTYHAGLWKQHTLVQQQRLPRGAIASIRASSSLKSQFGVSYIAENMLDGDPRTAWVEGAREVGVGEWIEVNFRRGVELTGIEMLNGYFHSSRAFVENGRVISFAVSIEDWDQSQRAVFETYSLPNTIAASTRGLTRPLSEYALDLPGAFTDCLLGTDWRRRDEPKNHPKRLRFRISKAARGSVYADTAVSELYLLGSYDPK